MPREKCIGPCRDDCSNCGTYGGGSVYRDVVKHIYCSHCGSIEIDGRCVNDCVDLLEELEVLRIQNSRLIKALGSIALDCNCKANSIARKELDALSSVGGIYRGED